MVSQAHAAPILVTGSHRSGTTWVGRVIESAGKVGYLHEPFNKDHRSGWFGDRITHWYPIVTDDVSKEMEADVRKVVTFRYPLGANLRLSRSAREVGRSFKQAARAYRCAIAGCRPLIKDPLAFFAAEWLYDKFHMDVVVLIRHPAAFCSSLKIKGWWFPFEDFVDQEELMSGLLRPYSNEIVRAARDELDIIDRGILLWNCVHHVVRLYQERHGDWYFVAHEALSRDPQAGFRAMFERLGLDFGERTRHAIEQMSGAHNPVEQTSRHEFARDSVANITNWKRRLEPNEIARIREGTAEVASAFYTDSDW